MLSAKFLKCRRYCPPLKIVKRHFTPTSQHSLLLDKTPASINNLKNGEIICGFQIKDIEDIDEFKIKAINLQHEKTKAKYLHLYRNDSNNVFSINFKTTPKNSTGLPHILEHLVLCGSQLYPVRDPFFKMLNRSLATFMNAMTGSDYTIYPFSTQNYADYFNLQKIYLDAVFNPNLNELDFMQEGWRFENENLKDKNSNLIIKGVVYNEMKGAFSENDNILMQKLQNLILPDHTYSVISGGDPLKIPNLTWEDLKNFHKAHYHPSNAIFYSYGNFPLDRSLHYIDTIYLSKYSYQDTSHTFVPSQTRWNEQKREHIPCRFDNMSRPLEQQNTISISLAMSDITNVYETFVMQFVTDLLIKGPNSPFYRALIEPNFSGGFTPSTGFDKQPRDSIFTIGLQGIKHEKFDEVVKIFDKTIDQIISTGFDSKHIESVLHSYELSIRYEGSNFGLAVLFELTPILNHRGNVIDALKVNNSIEKLKLNLKSDSTYLQKFIEKYFKNNKHRLILTMSADEKYDSQQLLSEKKMISERISGLSDVEKDNIYQKAIKLLEEQNTPIKGYLLPSLELGDIREHIDITEKHISRIGPVTTQFNLVESNGITYFKAILNTSGLTTEQRKLLPLFCYIITKMGTPSYNYREFDNLVSRKSSGLSTSVHLADSLHQLHLYELGILLSSYCLDNNISEMLNLWNEVFNITNIDNIDRFKMLVQLYVTNLTNGISDSGHIYAMQAASSLVSGSANQRELLSGLQHIEYMKKLVEISDYNVILTELNNIAKILFDKNVLRCSFNTSKERYPDTLDVYEKFLKNLPADNPIKAHVNSYSSTKINKRVDAITCQHHILNVPIYFCSKAVLAAPYKHENYASLKVLAKLLSSKYLHPELREKGGAYGGGARITHDGVFSFFSYRDPSHLQTLNVFDNAATWLEENHEKITAQDILEAKLGVFQSVDTPIPPGAKGDDEFCRRLTHDMLENHRNDIMKVDINDLRYVCCRFLNEPVAPMSKIILGPKRDDLNIEPKLGEYWTVFDKK